MYSIEEYALVKSDQFPSGYRIAGKTKDLFILFDDADEAANAVKQLLAENAEIFETEVEFRIKYPLQQLTFEERKFQTLAYWEENVAEHLWPNDIRQLIEQKKRNENQ